VYVFPADAADARAAVAVNAMSDAPNAA